MPLTLKQFADQAIAAPIDPSRIKTAEPERADIFKALDELTSNIDLMGEYLGHLEKRLTPVLVPESVNGETNGKQEIRACRSPLAGSLEFQSSKVIELGCRVSALLDRLSV